MVCNGVVKRLSARWRAVTAVLFVCGLMVFIVGYRINKAVISAGRPIFTNVADAPVMDVAIVFGAGYSGDKPSDMLYDRVATGVALYKAGKVRKLLMSGDNSRVGYNEPAIMRKIALQL